ncbi:MAG: OmpA family protein [Archangium sp.]|nr:OmpA family protein [Archangium sp.]
MRLPALLCALLSTTALADFGFPDWVKFPPQVGLAESQELVEETFADVELPQASGKSTVRGHHWTRWLLYTPAAGEKALGFYNGSEERIAKALAASFKASGWTTRYEHPEHTAFTLTQKRGAKEWNATVSIEGPTGQLRYAVVELGGTPTALTLKAPGKKPETIKSDQDLPWLTPPPGSTRTSEGHADDPLDVTPPGRGDDVQLVGNGAFRRAYKGPKTLSGLDFTLAYRAALSAAGWTVLWPTKNEDLGKVIAHYTKDGRDVWAVADYEYGANLSLLTTDVGAEDWATKLTKECQLPLTGVTFDFDKATLKPESTPLLEKAAATLKAVSGDIEVQGHTDNKGDADYNVKLSTARAKTVLDWLKAHGVAASRLTSAGFGMTVPIADNDTDLGRAKNRRVQLVKKGCAK